jgi:outer membrane protein
VPFTRCFHQFLAILLGVFILPSCDAAAQQAAKPPDRPLTLDQAVDYALANYPAVRAAQERMRAASKGVNLAQTAYLPRADMLWQMNRGTRNNIFGMVFPQSVVPAISGPVLPTTSDHGTWGSAAGLLVSWEPFDFGYRRATIEAARSREDRAQAELSLTQLDVAAAVGDAFMNLAAAQQQVKAAQADVERRQVLANVVHALVQQELRAGADASRADAELAAAKIQLIQVQEGERISAIGLAQSLGLAGAHMEIDASKLTVVLPSVPAASVSLAKHPLAEAANAELSEVHAREKALNKSYFPKFSLQAGVSGRGSGANTDGTFGTGADGLGLERRNWGIGLTATFSALDFLSLRPKKEIEQANQRAQQAQIDRTLQELTGRAEKAKATYESSLLIAQNVPVELQAARQGETQARARYQAGLATLSEVADAQRLLVRAESDDNLARLAAWRALFSVALAQGDLQPFLKTLRELTSGEGR